ncbi:Lhr family ATP-dependent helicase, partial [Levilactobacillus brevis]
DVPQAERNAQLLSMDPLVLERLLGTDNLAQVLDTQVIDSVAGQLASKTFWNELDKHDLRGRVNRYAKTHGPFTADRLLSELEIDAQTAVELLGELRDAGELINGRFDERLAPGVTQWVHADVLKRIRSQSLAKARAAIKPVEPERYEAFLVHRQGVGSVGGERLQGLDGLLRAIEQLEGVALPMPVWERHVFPARVRDYTPT